MSDKQTELNDIHAEIQIELAKQLLAKLKSGEWGAADANVARQLLKDNNIQAGTPQANPHLLRLAETLPFPDAQSA